MLRAGVAGRAKPEESRGFDNVRRRVRSRPYPAVFFWILPRPALRAVAGPERVAP